MNRHLLSLGAIATLLILPVGARADVIWSFAGGITKVDDFADNNNAWKFSGDDSDPQTTNDPSVTVSAWRQKSQTASSVIENVNGSLARWPQGLGVQYGSESSPQHAIDSIGPDEFLILHFNDAISLTKFNLGYVCEDNSYPYSCTNSKFDQADVTILAYTGAASNGVTATPDPTGKTLDKNTKPNITEAGWGLVGHYAAQAAGVHDISANSANIYSSYWAIGAYMANIGGTACTSCTGANDSFKLAAVTGKQQPPPTTTGNSVPAPPTLLLIALGLPFIRRGFARRVA